jgi:hypothetical protein
MKFWEVACLLLGTIKEVWAAPQPALRSTLDTRHVDFPRGVTLEMKRTLKPINGRQLKIAATEKFLER